MIDHAEIDAMAAKLSLALDEKLGLRRGSLARRVRKAGRRLPKRVRQQILQLAEAQKIAGNQHLARRLDGDALRAAQAEAMAHLASIDPRDRRIGAILGIAGGLVFNLILLVLALIMIWTVAQQ